MCAENICNLNKEKRHKMKKLLAVALTVVMISAAIFGTIVVKAEDVTVANHIIDSEGYHPDRSIYTVHGWSVTDTKIKKIGYKLDGAGDPYWLIEDVSDVSRAGNVSYTQGVDAFNEAFRDSALHDVIASNNLSGGLTDFYAYRIHVVLDLRDFAVTEGHSVEVVGLFENGVVKNVFRTYSISADDFKNKKTVDTFIGGELYRLTISNKNVSSSQTEKNELVVTSNATNTSDHYITVNLPNIDTSLYTSVSIKYKLDAGSTAAENQTYFKDSAKYKSYGATAGTWAAPRYIADGNWHVVTYLFRNDTYAFEPQSNPYAMAGKVLTGIRINCAATNGVIRFAWIKFNNVDSESCEGVYHTSKDQLRNEANVTLDTGANRDRNSTTLTNTAVIATSNYINVFGWIADSQKLYGTDADYCFGYQYGNEEPVFESTRSRGADDATIANQAPALGLTNGESVRFNVNVPVRDGADLSFWVLAKMEDGTIKRVWHVIYSNIPAIELGTAAFSGVTVNGTSVASGNPAAIGSELETNPIELHYAEDNVISAAGSAQVHNGYINKFAYRIDDGALVETSRFIDDSKTVPLKNKGYIDADHDAKGFYRFNVSTSALAEGNHTLKLYAICSDLSRSGNTEIELIEIPFEVSYIQPTFSSVSVSLAPGAVTDINFKVNKSDIEHADSVTVRFSFNGEEFIGVDSSEATDPVAVYKFSGIGPHQLADEVNADIEVKYGDEMISDNINYSVKQYCIDQLGAAPATNALNTLLVDLLRYGAAAQVYTNYNTDALATDGLTADQLAPGTDVTADLGLTQVSPMLTAMATGEKKVKWTAVALKLEGDVEIVLKLKKIDGKTFNNELTVKYTVDNDATVYSATMLNQNACQINMPVNKMNSVIHAVVYDGDEAVSNTVNYSIASYAAAKQNETLDSLGDLVKAMIRFGNAAAVYQPAV